MRQASAPRDTEGEVNTGRTEAADVGATAENAAGARTTIAGGNQVASGGTGQPVSSTGEATAHNENVENAGANKSGGQTALRPEDAQRLSAASIAPQILPFPRARVGWCTPGRTTGWLKLESCVVVLVGIFGLR